MRPFVDPSELTPEQIRREVASILAVGVLRLRKLRTEKAVDFPAEPAPERLEVPSETVLSVRTG